MTKDEVPGLLNLLLLLDFKVVVFFALLPIITTEDDFEDEKTVSGLIDFMDFASGSLLLVPMMEDDLFL